MFRQSSLILLIIVAFLGGCTASEKAKEARIKGAISALQAVYAPDKRTDRVVVALAGDTLRGYTTRPEVWDSINAWGTQYPDLINTVRLLPDARIGDKRCGIVKVAVANLRSHPGHSQELATQALLGTPLQLLDEQDGWYMVRTPDRYIAWLEPGAFVAMVPEAGQAWLEGDNRIYVGTSGAIMGQPGGGQILSTIVPGGIVEFYPEETDPEFTMIRLPDGVKGWLPKGDLMWPPTWWNPKGINPETLLSVAAGLAGRPYLWGGTSPNGMDCSGFTKMSYYLNGYIIPRDASQQVYAGEAVALTDDFANLQPGDQLFFGRLREDGSEKITHTGFYLGAGRFLHAGADNGRIKENSLLPDDEDFAQHRLESLLRARRLRPETEGVIPVGTAFKAMMR
ncbi:MAG: C40 family peptidase [Bacteroidota bacterium]